MTPPDFSAPLDALRQFHERQHTLCEALAALADQAEAGADAAALRAPAAEINRHFGVEAELHHRDEEEDLFPILARQSLKLADRVHQARSGHEELEAAWHRLGPALRDVNAIVADPATFAANARAFVELQQAHSHGEAEELLDMAQHILSAKQLDELSKAMRKRRGLA